MGGGGGGGEEEEEEVWEEGRVGYEDGKLKSFLIFACQIIFYGKMLLY